MIAVGLEELFFHCAIKLSKTIQVFHIIVKSIKKTTPGSSYHSFCRYYSSSCTSLAKGNQQILSICCELKIKETHKNVQ